MKFDNWTELNLFAAVLLSCYLFAEQLVIAAMAVSKNAYNTSVFCIYVISVTIILGSGMLRYNYAESPRFPLEINTFVSTKV